MLLPLDATTVQQAVAGSITLCVYLTLSVWRCVILDNLGWCTVSLTFSVESVKVNSTNIQYHAYQYDI